MSTTTTEMRAKRAVELKARLATMKVAPRRNCSTRHGRGVLWYFSRHFDGRTREPGDFACWCVRLRAPGTATTEWDREVQGAALRNLHEKD